MAQALITLSLPGHDRIFVDRSGVTHEALDTNHPMGTISLCGLLREPVKTENKKIDWLRAYASPSPPKGVDCMACLVRRARLDAMVDDVHETISLDVMVTC